MLEALILFFHIFLPHLHYSFFQSFYLSIFLLYSIGCVVFAIVGLCLSLLYTEQCWLFFCLYTVDCIHHVGEILEDFQDLYPWIFCI